MLRINNGTLVRTDTLESYIECPIPDVNWWWNRGSTTGREHAYFISISINGDLTQVGRYEMVCGACQPCEVNGSIQITDHEGDR